MWLMRWQQGVDVMRWQQGVDVTEGQAELIVQTINMTAGRWVSNELLAHPQYRLLSSVINNICHEISHNRTCMQVNSTTINSIDSKMQELVQLVLSDSPDDLDQDLKQTFLTVAKTFYYKAYCDPETINVHISKVMFETII
ncbi:unnamed protein product [Lactuca virosa]|uniref:Uncharacterized protein n=1 Tax=Lactuca virosa TaxID=75947 RepID=A0AAU9MQP8_9ASTR|nr:unnamed protein product [Lactuca virosa]